MRYPVEIINESNINCYLNVIDDYKSKFSNSLTLIFILKGSVEITIENSRYTLSEKDVFLINRWSVYSLNNIKENTICFFEINIEEYEGLYKGISNIQFINKFPKVYEMENEELYYLKAILARIVMNLIKKNKEYKLRCNGYICELLVLLIKKYSIPKDEENLCNERHKKIIQYINKNYREKITLDDIANNFYLNPQYTSRYFSKNMGMTLNEYITEVRLQAAILSLKTEKKKISEIALDTGFPNEKSFFKSFKDKYNMTPGKYQREWIEIKNENKNDDKITKLFEENIFLNLNKYVAITFTTPSLFEEDKETIDIRINKKNINGNKKLNRYWNYICPGVIDAINFKHSLIKQLSILQEENKFRYIRVVNIISNKNILNSLIIDEVLDSLMDIKIRPIININLNSNCDEKKSFNVINKFIYHIIKRYGKEECNKWYFEFNVDNISKENIEYYFKVKNLIVEFIGREIKVGILFNSLKCEYSHSLIDIEKEGVIDFITIDYFENRDYYCYENTISEKIKTSKQILKSINLKYNELFIVNWDSDYKDINLINDTAFKGTYIVKNICDNLNEINSLSYKNFSDITIENDEYIGEFFGGNGLISMNNLKKESYYCHYLLNKLGQNIISKGQWYIITSDAEGCIKILMYNYCKVKENNKFIHKEMSLESNIYELFEERIKRGVIKITGLEGNFIKKVYTVNRVKGNSFEEWCQIGKPIELDKEELDYINKKSIYEYKLSKIISSNEIIISKKLFPHEVTLVELVPIQ